jgi:chemotaxis signal transduction protein
MKTEASETSTRFLWFEQAGSRFAASMDYLQEISPLGNLRPLPTRECALAGLTTLRDEVLPVFSPILLVNGGGSHTSAAASLVVLKLPHGGCFGLLADGIGRITDIPSVAPAEKSFDYPGAFAGVSRVHGRGEILVLDVPGLASITGLDQGAPPAGSMNS